jgi:hypothetical protein
MGSKTGRLGPWLAIRLDRPRRWDESVPWCYPAL